MIATKSPRKVRRFLAEMAVTDEAVRARLVEAREAAGYTQQTAATRLYVSKSTLEKWERLSVPEKRIAQLAEFYGVTREWILYGENIVAESTVRDELAYLRAEVGRLEGIETTLEELMRIVREGRDGKGSGP